MFNEAKWRILKIFLLSSSMVRQSKQCTSQGQMISNKRRSVSLIWGDDVNEDSMIIFIQSLRYYYSHTCYLVFVLFKRDIIIIFDRILLKEYFYSNINSFDIIFFTNNHTKENWILPQGEIKLLFKRQWNIVSFFRLNQPTLTVVVAAAVNQWTNTK